MIDSRSRYFWGRKFIVLARILAALTLLAGLLLTGLTLRWTLVRLEALPPGLTPEFRNEILLRQKNLRDDYEKTVNSLSLIQQRMISAQQDFVIPSSLTLLDTVFDDRIETPDQLDHSRQVLDAYRRRIDGLKKLIAEQIQRQISAIAPKIALPSDRALTQNPGISVHNRQLIRFYRSDKEAALKEFRDAIGDLKTGGKFDQIREPVAYLERFGDAISGNLSGSGQVLQVSPAAAAPAADPGLEREIRAVDALRTIDHCVREINAEWVVEDDLKQLGTTLDAADRQLEMRRSLRDTVLLQGLLGSLVFFFTLAFGSLMILVAADFLRAHFDSADALAAGGRDR